jgi:hypothetical protein
VRLIQSFTPHCFSAGALTSLGGGGVSAAAAAAAQSPAQILVPLTVPTNLQPIGACDFT